MEEQPNIFFIITDQQRYDTINALGFPFVDTPNLDRLVREGVSFSNCHVAAPSCASARASLFTGYFPYTTGIMKNADAWKKSWVNMRMSVFRNQTDPKRVLTEPSFIEWTITAIFVKDIPQN